MLEKMKQALGLQPVGEVDLEAVNKPTRPDKLPREERKANRERMILESRQREEQHNREVIIAGIDRKIAALESEIEQTKAQSDELCRQRDEIKGAYQELQKKKARKAYLEKKSEIRNKYNDFSHLKAARQTLFHFNGIRPEKMDVVHFHVPSIKGAEEMDGVALCRDENHYYLAVDMYGNTNNEDNCTTILDENPDGTFEGIWPKNVVLKKASKFEERYMRQLADKYADDIEAAEKVVKNADITEGDEIKNLETEIIELEQKLTPTETHTDELQALGQTLAKLNEDLRQAQSERARYTNPTEHVAEDYEPMEGLDLDTEAEQRYTHLPYLRGKRKMLTMNWPMIDDNYEPWLRYRLMGNIARQIKMLHGCKALTYVMTEDYYNELVNRGRNYYRSMKIDDMLKDDDNVAGVLVFPSQGHEDTILYHIRKREQLTIVVTYIREGRLLFYESYSTQEIVSMPRTDVFMCDSLKQSGTDSAILFSHIRRIIISFLAMEQDMERTVSHLVEEGKGSSQEQHYSMDEEIDIADDNDVVIRDANWYTDITVNRVIPVRGYISHRWCGSGKEKFIKEVWVRPHLKQGYHRSAGVSSKV